MGNINFYKKTGGLLGKSTKPLLMALAMRERLYWNINPNRIGMSQRFGAIWTTRTICIINLSAI